MKRSIAILTIMVTMGFFYPSVSQAQCGNLRHSHSKYTHTHKSCVGDKHKHGRSFWQKHRDKITTGGGALGGAVIGGILGGKKGAAIGALTGGGGAAVYTYGIRKRRRSARH